jgi:site-specific recombinase XerD
MGVKVREKRGKLYLDIYHGGKRSWEALHLTLTSDKMQNKEIRRLAEVCRSKRETQLLAAAWDIQDPVAGKMRLATYLEDYAKTYGSPGNVRNLIFHVKEFPGGETVLISQVSPRWVESFLKYLLSKNKITGEPLSQNSVVTYMAVFKGALKAAVAHNIITQDPSAPVETPGKIEQEMVYLDIEELQSMAEVRTDDPYSAEVRRAFLFACYTGLRVSDIETITWGKISFNPMQIIKAQKKTKALAYIPLGKSAQSLIIDGAKHEPDELIFRIAEHCRNRSYKYLKVWTKQAGVKKNIAWHTARRTFATMAFENGVDIYTVAKLLGHKGLNQVARYAKVTDKLRREAIAMLPEIDL